VAAVMDGPVASMVSEKLREAVAPTASVTVEVKENAPTVVGVPAGGK